MKLAALLLLALPVFSQVTAVAKPVSISGAQGALGSKTVGLWNVSLTSRYPVQVDLARERITQAFPSLRDIPNQLAEDLLNRQSSNSFWSVVGRWGPTVLTVAAAAYGGHAIAVGNQTQALIAQGVSMAPLLFTRANARAPAPGVLYSSLCPDRVSLVAFGAASCYLASGLIKGAAPMTAEIELPGVGGPIADLVSPQLSIERLTKILSARGLSAVEIQSAMRQ